MVSQNIFLRNLAFYNEGKMSEDDAKKTKYLYNLIENIHYMY